MKSNAASVARNQLMDNGMGREGVFPAGQCREPKGTPGWEELSAAHWPVRPQGAFCAVPPSVWSVVPSGRPLRAPFYEYRKNTGRVFRIVLDLRRELFYARGGVLTNVRYRGAPGGETATTEGEQQP